MKVSKLKRNQKNPRQITGDKLEKLKASVGSFQKMMAIRPIVVDENFVVLGGNMRLAAIKALGLKDIPDEWVKQVELSEDEKREFVIKDNVSGGEWDADLLANEWSDLPLTDWGLDLPGFEAVEEVGSADAEPQIDKAAELNKKWKVKSGDLWQIGEHRLLCGDSTNAENVARLLNGEKPNLMVTDPPYGVEYDAEWRQEAGIKNCENNSIGKVLNDDNADWLPAWSNAPSNIAYVWSSDRMAYETVTSIIAAGYEVRGQIIWTKEQGVISRGHYNPQHEPCWYAVRKGETAHWIGDNTQTTVWQINKSNRSDTGHSTQKPLECMARPIRNHEGDVYEPFAGSGTTLVACQNLNRKCYAIEISENYCAVILERMQTAFPSLEIKRIEDANR